MLPCFYYLCTGLIMCNISKLYDIIIIKEKKDMNRFEYTILNLKEFDVRMRRFNWAIYFNGILVNTVWNDLDLYYFMLNKGIFKNLHYLNFSKIDKKIRGLKW